MKPASGPEYSVPAIGCAGTKCTPAGTSGPTSRITDCLVEPTSVSDRARRQMRRDRRGEVGERADRRAQHHAVGALDRPAGIELDPIGEAQLAHPVQRLLRARVDHDLGRRGRRARVAMRATELPISPTPISARRRNSGSAIAALPP